MYAILNDRFTLLVEWTVRVVICSACIDLINSSVPSDMFFFNKIAIQATTQVAADNEAVALSR